jgi:hypothetical protein
MAESLLKRSVLVEGVMYEAGNREHEELLQDILAPSQADKLILKEYLHEDFEARGEEPEVDENEVDQRSVGQRLRQKSGHMAKRRPEVARNAGVTLDAEGQRIDDDLDIREPDAKDVAAREELGLEVEDEDETEEDDVEGARTENTQLTRSLPKSGEQASGAKKGAKKSTKKGAKPNPFAKPE